MVCSPNSSNFHKILPHVISQECLKKINDLASLRPKGHLPEAIKVLNFRYTTRNSMSLQHSRDTVKNVACNVEIKHVSHIRASVQHVFSRFHEIQCKN